MWCLHSVMSPRVEGVAISLSAVNIFVLFVILWVNLNVAATNLNPRKIKVPMKWKDIFRLNFYCVNRRGRIKRLILFFNAQAEEEFTHKHQEVLRTISWIKSWRSEAHCVPIIKEICSALHPFICWRFNV